MPTPSAEFPFHYELRVDLPATISLATIAGATYLLNLSPPRELNGLPKLGEMDAKALEDLQTRYDATPGDIATARTGSDVLLFGTLGAPLIAGLSLGLPHGKWRDGAVLVGIAYEATLATWLATDLVKLSAGRPRPYVYLCDGEGDFGTCVDTFDGELGVAEGDSTVLGSEAFVSFFSGHTSVVAATSFSVAHMIATSGKPSPLRIVVPYGLATGLTVATGALRVEAGKHFPTDVIVGGLFGLGVGIVVPEMHRVNGGAALASCSGEAGPVPCVVASGKW